MRPEDRDWLGVVLGARYDNSPIVISDGPAPVDQHECYVPSSIPGGRAPHLWLDDRRGAGSSLFDRFGRYFTLLRIGDGPPDTTAFEDATRRLGMPLTVVDVPLPQAAALYERRLALVRPDQHIAWRGDALPPNLHGLLGRAIGR